MFSKNYSWRFYFLVFLLLIGASGLVARLVYLGTIKSSFLNKQSAARSVRVISIHAHRGMIVDRNGVPLAISTPVEAAWLSPQLFKPKEDQELALARLLQMNVKLLRKRVLGASDKGFVYLKRRLTKAQAEEIKALQIPGIFIQKEYQRYFPEGEVMAQVLGFTDIDDHGVEGLELAYDHWLRGTAGKKEVSKDRLGHIVNELRVVTPPKAGNDLVLSLDRRIQYLAYKELQNNVESFGAESGSAVVLDVKTGEILAMVNQPSYNPNMRLKMRTPGFRNRAVTDLFEPGSTIKTFSIASALESGKYRPKSKIDTNPGWLIISGNKVEDHGVNYGVLTLKEILQKSNNVGIAKVTLSLSPNRLVNFLKKVGFGEITYSGFPGEAIGSLPDHLKWRPFVLATLAFGYAMSTTTLQLARAYSVFGDDGILRAVSFLKQDKPLPGTRVIDPKIARETLNMLESVLQTGGTGRRAKVAGYTVAGKTGTAGIAGPHGYKKDQYNAIFVGLAPARDPRLAVAVVIKNPQKIHTGGVVAAPVFAKIMAGALRILNVRPDSFEGGSL